MACFVVSCKSHSSRKESNGTFVSFHRMPPNEKENWCKMIPRVRNFWTMHSRICSKHFTDDCFESSDKWRRLKPGTTPSLLLDTSDDDDEYFYQNPTSHAPSPPFQIKTERQTDASHATKIYENEIPISSSSCCTNSTNKIRKLEQELEKVKKLCRKRLLKMNAFRKQTKRLKQRNLILQHRLIKLVFDTEL